MEEKLPKMMKKSAMEKGQEEEEKTGKKSDKAIEKKPLKAHCIFILR